MKLLIGIIILLSLFSGCKKYPDDEKKIHLLSVKERLCPICWNTEQWQNGNDCMTFKRDGSFQGYYAPLYFNGTWQLLDHYNKLHFINSSNNAIYDFDIIRLEKRSDGRHILWLKNDTSIFYFIQHKD